MVEAAEGLAHMKERGFAHLDVKPSNVITGNPACLVDLGIARSLEEAGGIKSAAGTDAFMAPEQCFPAGRRVGSPADVWGWGATLYLAIVGRPPFPRPRDGRTGPGARWPQVGGTLEIPGNTPVAIREVITLCLQENAAARPSIEEAARSLRNGLP
jgi:serine/threonine protein kinase